MPQPIHAVGLAAIPGIRHGFFTREGGTSRGIYASLNCGLGSSDARESVQANRGRVAEALATRRDHVVTLYQCHSNIALTLDRPAAAADLPRADALVTRTPGLAVAALAADCAPVLFADPEVKVVGAAHAGWRGALGGILEATIEAMERLGARRDHIIAAVGPCIGPAAYEVGPEFVAAFLERDREHARFFTTPDRDGKARFDLPGFVQHRLTQCRLAAVEAASACTYTNESLFFSYRRATHRKEPDYGRQISAIVVT